MTAALNEPNPREKSVTQLIVVSGIENIEVYFLNTWLQFHRQVADPGQLKVVKLQTIALKSHFYLCDTHFCAFD